ncbi:MAG: NAD-dependent succinate-semialdehyde dehydrogenase [Prochlorothrix sp.]
MAITTTNPATGAIVKTFDPIRPEELEAKLSLGMATFQRYRLTTFADRASRLFKVADLLEAQAEELGKLMTLEMGKPLKGAIAEANKCAMVCRYYGQEGTGFLADRPAQTDASQSFVRYLPLGMVLAVMPWNFPLWQVFRFAAPALMAGNVALLKHASNVPQCAQAIEDLFLAAGFEPGVFQNLFLEAHRVAGLVQDDRVQAATLTGSEPAGASLAAACGSVIKPTVLELGGSDPFIVTASADLDLAAEVGTQARMLNNGQSCIAAKRFIVLDSVADAFAEKLTAQFATLKVGDPMDLETDIGPLATLGILEELDQQVQTCLKMGAKALIGGRSLRGSTDLPEALRSGYFYAPTLLADFPPGTPADQEEFFGPVALLFRVATLDQAISLANSTRFGLGASVWTTDPAEIERSIRDLDAGAVFINGLVKSDPRLPFGGIKRSGYGRELAAEGIRAFVNAKTVWIR